MMNRSLYIHIPFCKNICSYCDFRKFYYNKKWILKYLEALDKEVDERYEQDLIKTIYIGGGTPSSLDKEELQILFNTIKKIKLTKEYEFTFECNIEDINEELLLFLKNNKVNRLSIGLQSFNKRIIDILGRKYPTNTLEKINLSKRYIPNINIDLIYGVYSETLEELADDLDKILSLNIPHISLYALILEDNTILKTTNYIESSDDIQRSMYDYICNRLKDNNYIHYEISNFAKDNYYSKHNLTYWNNDEYYGFGLSASGFLNNIRYTNTSNLSKYIDNNYKYIEEVISKKINMENEMILNLRKIKGISKNDFYNKYKVNIEDVFDVSRLSFNKDYYYIKESDLFISNDILSDFINI